MPATSDIPINPLGPGAILIGGAAVLLYAGSRAGVDALVNDAHEQPGRRAIGHLLPIACVVIWAALCGRFDAALMILFASSVTAMTIAMGAALVVSPRTLASPHRACALLLPVALLVFVAGFQGRFRWMHAIAMLLQGLVILLLWTEPAGADVPPLRPARSRSATARGVELLVSLLPMILGAWAMIRGLGDSAQTLHTADTLLAGGLVAPLLVMPMLGDGMTLAHRNRQNESIAASVGLVMLNFCLLLPAVIAIHQARQYFLSLKRELDFQWQSLTYPLSLWRIDATALLLVAAFLLPVAWGRWTIGRVAGMVLIAGFVVYYLLMIIVH